MNIYQEMHKKELKLIETLLGKTIQKLEFNKQGNLIMNFTDGKKISVCYHCQGGVFVSEETNE